MITIECIYSNGETVTTKFNGSLENAKNYYIGNVFNIGVVSDNLQECIDVKTV